MRQLTYNFYLSAAILIFASLNFYDYEVAECYY